MIILAPPSEGKSSKNTVNEKFIETNYIFKDRVEKILSILNKLDEKKIVSTYSTTLDKARVLHKNNLNIFDQGCSKAIERYTGVVFKNIKWSCFNEKMKIFFNNNFLILNLMNPNQYF